MTRRESKPPSDARLAEARRMLNRARPDQIRRLLKDIRATAPQSQPGTGAE